MNGEVLDPIPLPPQPTRANAVVEARMMSRPKDLRLVEVKVDFFMSHSRFANCDPSYSS